MDQYDYRQYLRAGHPGLITAGTAAAAAITGHTLSGSTPGANLVGNILSTTGRAAYSAIQPLANAATTYISGALQNGGKTLSNDLSRAYRGAVGISSALAGGASLRGNLIGGHTATMTENDPHNHLSTDLQTGRAAELNSDAASMGPIGASIANDSETLLNLKKNQIERQNGNSSNIASNISQLQQARSVGADLGELTRLTSKRKYPPQSQLENGLERFRTFRPIDPAPTTDHSYAIPTAGNPSTFRIRQTNVPDRFKLPSQRQSNLPPQPQTPAAALLKPTPKKVVNRILWFEGGTPPPTPTRTTALDTIPSSIPDEPAEKLRRGNNGIAIRNDNNVVAVRDIDQVQLSAQELDAIIARNRRPTTTTPASAIIQKSTPIAQSSIESRPNKHPAKPIKGTSMYDNLDGAGPSVPDTSLSYRDPSIIPQQTANNIFENERVDAIRNLGSAVIAGAKKNLGPATIGAAKSLLEFGTFGHISRMAMNKAKLNEMESLQKAGNYSSDLAARGLNVLKRGYNSGRTEGLRHLKDATKIAGKIVKKSLTWPFQSISQMNQNDVGPINLGLGQTREQYAGQQQADLIDLTTADRDTRTLLAMRNVTNPATGINQMAFNPLLGNIVNPDSTDIVNTLHGTLKSTAKKPLSDVMVDVESINDPQIKKFYQARGQTTVDQQSLIDLRTLQVNRALQNTNADPFSPAGLIGLGLQNVGRVPGATPIQNAEAQILINPPVKRGPGRPPNNPPGRGNGGGGGGGGDPPPPDGDGGAIEIEDETDDELRRRIAAQARPEENAQGGGPIDVGNPYKRLLETFSVGGIGAAAYNYFTAPPASGGGAKANSGQSTSDTRASGIYSGGNSAGAQQSNGAKIGSLLSKILDGQSGSGKGKLQLRQLRKKPQKKKKPTPKKPPKRKRQPPKRYGQD